MFLKPQLSLSALKDFMGLHPTYKGWDQPKDDCHTAICALGANWLVRVHNCRAVMVEKGGSGYEMPDAIGFRYQDSYLLEAKISRADFLADRNKPHRMNPAAGMGKYRFYICPKDLISADEVPEKWGLLYVSPKGIIRKIKDAQAFDEYDRDAEFAFLTSALATPWKLFQHWTEEALEHLYRLHWIDPKTEVDLKLFSARIHINRLMEQEICE